MGAVLEEEEYYKNTYYHKYASEKAPVIFTGTNVEHDFHFTYYYLSRFSKKLSSKQADPVFSAHIEINTMVKLRIILGTGFI